MISRVIALLAQQLFSMLHWSMAQLLVVKFAVIS
jgi:hypothetical protein